MGRATLDHAYQVYTHLVICLDISLMSILCRRTRAMTGLLRSSPMWLFSVTCLFNLPIKDRWMNLESRGL